MYIFLPASSVKVLMRPTATGSSSWMVLELRRPSDIGVAGAGSEPPLPTVFMAVIARNAEETLPVHLALLERQDYPKDRIHVYVSTDRGRDGTVQLLHGWVDRLRGSGAYASVALSRATKAASTTKSMGV